MRRPMASITAWTCLLLVYLLPAQSMHNVQDAENLGRVASTPHPPATDFAQVGHDASDLNGHPPPSNREREGGKVDHPTYEPQPNPRVPKNKSLREQLNPIPHLNKLKQKLLERMVVPKFLQKIYKFISGGFIHLFRPKRKTVQEPWIIKDLKRMDKDITKMIRALRNHGGWVYLDQLSTHRYLYILAKPAFKAQYRKPGAAKSRPSLLTAILISKARKELTKLDGKNAIFSPKEQERHILLVKTLVVLSRNPAYKDLTIRAIEAVVKSLESRKNPEDLPKIMPYIRAAHYVITTEDPLFDSSDHLAQPFLESNELCASFAQKLKEQNLKSWLRLFATSKLDQVKQIHQSMLDNNLKHFQQFDEILRWSSEVLHPANSPRGSTDEVIFALETLHVLSLHKPKKYVNSLQKLEPLGAHNPAFQSLLNARNAWRGTNQPDKGLLAAIELTLNSVLKKYITPFEEYMFYSHRQEFKP